MVLVGEPEVNIKICKSVVFSIIPPALIPYCEYPCVLHDNGTCTENTGFRDGVSPFLRERTTLGNLSD